MVPATPTAFRRIQGVVTYRQLWRALEDAVARHVPSRNVVLFAEIVDHTIPQVLHSTGGLYESFMPDHARAMIVTSPLHTYMKSNPGQRIIRWEDFAGGRRELMRSSHYRRYLKPHGWSYFATLAFYREKELVGTVILSRGSDEGNFSSTEYEWLERLHTELDIALRRCALGFNDRLSLNAARRLLDRMPQAVVLADWELRIVGSTRAGREACHHWNFGPSSTELYSKRANLMIPPPLIAAVRRAKEGAFKSLHGYQPLRKPLTIPSIRHPKNGKLSARVTMVPDARGALSLPFWRIEFESMDEASHPGESSLGGMNGNPDQLLELTPTEQTVAKDLLQGLSNEEIATRRGKAVGTVKNHVSAILGKCGVRSRAELIVSLSRRPDEELASKKRRNASRLH